MERIKKGDRIWVKNPTVETERKIGTIMAIKKTRGGLKYLVEWEVDLGEMPNHHPGYMAREIVAAAHE